MELPATNSFEQNELKNNLNRVISFAVTCGADLGLSGVRNKMRPAVFYYKDLYQNYNVGWHFQNAELGSGEYGHYDHGVGIQRNKDLRYSYVVPYFSDALEYLYSQATKKPLNLNGIFLFKDGTHKYGGLTSSCKRYAKEDGRSNTVTYFFNSQVVDRSFLSNIVAQVPLPSRQSGVWTKDTNELKVGEKVFFHDGENSRFGYVYSSSENKRYQRYTGLLISGLPLPSITGGWCREDKMLSFLQLENAYKISKQY